MDWELIADYRTTTELTTSIAAAIAEMLGLGTGAKVVEAVIRVVRIVWVSSLQIVRAYGG